MSVSIGDLERRVKVLEAMVRSLIDSHPDQAAVFRSLQSRSIELQNEIGPGVMPPPGESGYMKPDLISIALAEVAARIHPES